MNDVLQGEDQRSRMLFGLWNRELETLTKLDNLELIHY